MTNYGDTNAWIRLTYGSDALYINAEDWEYDDDDINHFTGDYPNWSHVGITFNSHKVGIKLINVWVATEAAWNVLKAQLKAAAQATTCTVRIQISSTPTYELLDGETGADEMPVIIAGKKGHTKPFKGDGTKFMIKQIYLKLVGAAT